MTNLPPASGLRGWFEATLEQPDTLRTEWLTAHCPDPDLLARVLALVRQQEQGELLELELLHAHFAEVESQAATINAVDWSGRVLGEYRLQRCIGEGGMSVVYLAQSLNPNSPRDVAIKLLRVGLHAEDRQKAFAREREALARLDHPNIARLIDGGIVEGTPYLVLDFIDGVPLNQYAQQRALDLHGRLALFATTCRAVEAAHRLLIVHRDLKPSNVLVTGAGVVKLLDFGIAKLLDSDEPATRTARVALTPDYAAPEQFSNELVSTATDVFALGVMLHELLTGVRPERGWTTRPSVIVSRIADTDLPAGLSLRPLRANLAGDLDNVILKAIDPEPEHRYGSAGRLADDVENHLAGLPVSAHPPSRWYRTRKFMRRHRGAVSLSALLGLGLLVSLGFAIHQGRHAADEARAAQRASALATRETLRANAVRDYLLDIFRSAQQQLPEGKRPTPQQLVQAAAAKLESGTEAMDDATRAALYSAYADISATQSEHDDAANAYAHAADLLAGEPSLRAAWLTSIFRRANELNAGGQTNEALALAESLLPEIRARDDLGAVEALSNWSDVLMSAGRFDEAIEVVDDMAARSARLSDPDSREARFRSVQPGWLRVSAGRIKEAEPLLRRAVDAWRQSNTEKDAEFAGSLSTLSNAVYQLGNSEEALALLQEALELSRSIYRGPHERIAGILETLSAIELNRGDLEAAARHISEAVQIIDQLFGRDHPQSISKRLTAATIDWERVGVEHAIGDYRSIAAICASSKQEATNPDCARTWQNLATALMQAKHPDEALQANEHSLALRAKLFGEEHDQYAASLAGHAAILGKRKRYVEALSFLDRALAIMQKNGTVEGINAGAMQRSRAWMLLEQGRLDEALAALEFATSAAERFSANDVALNATLLGLHAIILGEMGRTDQARREASRALQLDPDLSQSGAAYRLRIHALAESAD